MMKKKPLLDISFGLMKMAFMWIIRMRQFLQIVQCLQNLKKILCLLKMLMSNWLSCPVLGL